jgi:superfamily I DNA/RNA helicase
MANSILQYKTAVTGCEPFKIEGTKSIRDRWVPYKEMENTIHTVLHRTVAGTLETALAHKDKPVYWIGGLENYNVQELLDVYHLSVDLKDKIKRKKLLSEFRSYSLYEEASEQAGDPEMKRICKLIKEHGGRLVNYVDKLRINEAKDELDAKIVIGTSHRSKGLEFDSVRIAEDFIDLFDESNEMTSQEIADELNLLYVAGTRAIKRLSANSLMYQIHEEVKKIKEKKFKTERKPVPVIED